MNAVEFIIEPNAPLPGPEQIKPLPRRVPLAPSAIEDEPLRMADLTPHPASSDARVAAEKARADELLATSDQPSLSRIAEGLMPPELQDNPALAKWVAAQAAARLATPNYVELLLTIPGDGQQTAVGGRHRDAPDRPSYFATQN